MKGSNLWSYSPYKPPLREVGNPYICRVVPYSQAIHFEWLANGSENYSVYYRVRGEEEFIFFTETNGTECDITGLKNDTDYEFYVECAVGKSLVRIAHTGECVGSIVNYLHPDDTAYDFSGRYLCSPSLVRHPDGYLLASMDLYNGSAPQNLTLIFRSDDDGENWHYVSELMPCFWGKMFIHRNELYMLSVNTEYGDLLIGKSQDGGKTFSAPVVLLRGGLGKGSAPGIHKNPQNVVSYKGRIYETLEWGTWSPPDFHAAMVMSCDENDDLLIPENWSFTEPVMAPQYVSIGEHIEGTLTVAPDGKLVSVMRSGNWDMHAVVYEVDTPNPEAPLKFSRFMKFPCHRSKFMIKFDEVAKKYYSVATRIYADNGESRNLLSLMVSPDLENWEVAYDIFDYRGVDDERIGFQYVDFYFEGDDIIFLCRTAFNNASTYHNSNYSTFHRIKNFRNI